MPAQVNLFEDDVAGCSVGDRVDVTIPEVPSLKLRGVVRALNGSTARVEFSAPGPLAGRVFDCRLPG